MKNPVGWFEIATTNLERAKKFYQDVFEIHLEYCFEYRIDIKV